MEIKEILKTSILFLNKTELLQDIYFVENTNSFSDTENQKQINLLVDCLNLVYQEITTEYFPLVCEEEVVLEDGKLEYTKLSKTLNSIISAKTNNGYKIKFSVFPDHAKFETSSNKVKVKYSYERDDITIDDIDIETFGGKISKRLLAYGIAMEYCFISSLSDEALIWENRYKDCLKNMLRKRHDITLPKRRWI